jgi:hypothetical protein
MDGAAVAPHTAVQRPAPSTEAQCSSMRGAELSERTPVALVLPLPPLMVLRRSLGVAAVPASSITLTPYESRPALPPMTLFVMTAPVLPCTVTAAFVGTFAAFKAKPSRIVGAVTLASK